MFIAGYRRQPFIGRIMLPVIAGKYGFKLLGIKKLHRLFPAALRQIGKVKQILDVSQTGSNRFRHNRYRKGKVILSMVGNHIETAFYLFAHFHSSGMKTVQYLILTAAENFGDTLHAKIRRSHMSFRHLSLRTIYQKKSLADLVGMERQLNARAGKVQRPVINIKFAL